MKRILALVIALLAVILTFPVSAAEKSIEDMIYEEVIQLVDIKDYPADPTDTEIYLLSLVEHGYTKDGWASDNALYLYLYNPSCKEISNSELNTVQMASSWDEDGKPNGFRKYSLCVEGSALNGLYIRAKVGVSAKTVARVANSKRLYGITEFELLEDSSYSAINATDATAYEVGYSYAFSGYGDSITCERTSYLTITLNVEHTSYLTGDSALGIGYSNQVSSVYFSVPREIEEKYGALYNIEYEYYKYRTSPMLVTTNETFYKEMLACVGKTADKDDWPIGIQATYYEGMSGTNFYFHYGHMNWLDDIFNDPTCDLISTVFLSSTLNEGDQLVSSEALTAYFQNYKSSATTEKVRGYSVDLFDMSQYADNDHYIYEKKTRDDVFDMDSFADTHNWYQGVINYGLFYDKDMHDETITNAKYIQPVTSADFVVADFSKEFLVSENDIVSLAKYCQNAEKNSENVYLLRFATSDCYTQDVLQLYPFWKLSVDNLKAWYNDSTGKRVSTKALTFIEEDVYLDFDIISLGFSDDGEDVTTIGVVMSPVDIFPNLEGIQTSPDPIPVPDDDTWKKLLAIILLAVGALGIARLVGKLGEIGQAKTNREIRKYLKNQNKNQNRRR